MSLQELAGLSNDPMGGGGSVVVGGSLVVVTSETGSVGGVSVTAVSWF